MWVLNAPPCRPPQLASFVLCDSSFMIWGATFLSPITKLLSLLTLRGVGGPSTLVLGTCLAVAWVFVWFGGLLWCFLAVWREKQPPQLGLKVCVRRPTLRPQTDVVVHRLAVCAVAHAIIATCARVCVRAHVFLNIYVSVSVCACPFVCGCVCFARTGECSTLRAWGSQSECMCAPCSVRLCAL